ncbi:MAG: hypothetical protein ACXWQR_02570 [Ktedonobacterales bacterium]
MRQVVQSLLFASQRGLAICATLAGLAAGLFALSFGTAFICFDSCPNRALYFSNLGPGTVPFIMPCVVLELLALTAFVAYCVATQQARRTIVPILFFVVGGLVGVVSLDALLQHGQTTLPVNSDGLLVEAHAVEWAQLWGAVSHPRRRRLVRHPCLPAMAPLSDGRSIVALVASCCAWATNAPGMLSGVSHPS